MTLREPWRPRRQSPLKKFLTEGSPRKDDFWFGSPVKISKKSSLQLPGPSTVVPLRLCSGLLRKTYGTGFKNMYQGVQVLPHMLRTRHPPRIPILAALALESPEQSVEGKLPSTCVLGPFG